MVLPFGGHNAYHRLIPHSQISTKWIPQDAIAPQAAEIRAGLADCRVYKVGHHGSLNATPRTLLRENFHTAHRPADQRLTTILSTMPGKHGSRGHGAGTEVPRQNLVDELKHSSDLADTRTATKAQFWVDRTIAL